MGYDMGWGLRRGRPLDAEETARLTTHVESWVESIIGYSISLWTRPEPRPDRFIATASLRPEPGEDDEDAAGGYSTEVQERVFEALGELRTLVDGAELIFSDDFYEYVWSKGGFEPQQHGAVIPPSGSSEGWTTIAPKPTLDRETTDEDDDDDEDDDEGEDDDAD